MFNIRNETGDYFTEGELVAACKLGFVFHGAVGCSVTLFCLCLQCTFWPRPVPKVSRQSQESHRKHGQLVALAHLCLHNTGRGNGTVFYRKQCTLPLSLALSGLQGCNKSRIPPTHSQWEFLVAILAIAVRIQLGLHEYLYNSIVLYSFQSPT